MNKGGMLNRIVIGSEFLPAVYLNFEQAIVRQCLRPNCRVIVVGRKSRKPARGRPITMLLSLPVELGYCLARAAAAAAWLWWLPVGGGGGLGTVDLVAVVEVAASFA